MPRPLTLADVIRVAGERRDETFSGNYTSVVMIDGVKNASTGGDWKPAS